jgi:hypothetical protein
VVVKKGSRHKCRKRLIRLAHDFGFRWGKKELAFQFLTKAYETRQGIVELPVEPELDNIRSDSRYADLLHRVGLAP